MGNTKTRAEIATDERRKQEYQRLISSKQFASNYAKGEYLISLGKDDAETCSLLILAGLSDDEFNRLWKEFREKSEAHEKLYAAAQVCLTEVGYRIYFEGNWDKLGKEFILLHTPPALDKEAVLKFARDKFPEVEPDDFLKAVETKKKWQEDWIFGTYRDKTMWRAAQIICCLFLLVVAGVLLIHKPLIFIAVAVGLFLLGWLIRSH